MKPDLGNIEKYIKPLTRYLLVAAVIGFISLLFPEHARFEFQFAKGQSWHYDNLVAEFDFPILKPAEQLDEEIEEIKKDFSPYYRFDLNAEKFAIRNFEQSFSNQLEAAKRDDQFHDVVQNPSPYRKYAVNRLRDWYESGIVKIASEHEEKGNDFVINLVRGNKTEKRTFSSLPTMETVRENMSDSLPYSRLKEAEFLLFVLEDAINPNIFYDDTLTEKFQREQLAEISTSSGLVRKGEVIVQKGATITPEIYQKLISYRQKYEEKTAASETTWGIFTGYLLLTSLIIIAFLMYLRSFLRNVLTNIPRLSFILMWFVLFAWMVYAVENTENLSAYLIPFCIVPIVVKNFFTDRLAFFTHIVNVLIASFLSVLGYEFTFMQVVAGIVAVLTTADARNWNKFFMAILVIFITYCLSFLGLSLITKGTLAQIDTSVFGWLFLNGVLTMLAFPLIPLLGRVFGFTTAISLVELSDMNRPLLKDLALKASGTLQHSLQVGNLAEAAANAIGADPLLVKVGALYHDVGKVLNPRYFIENQSGENPHDKISNYESAQIIIGHVTGGVELARKARVPRVLVDFILTHHGTTRVEYFYRNYIKENPEESVNEQDFRYPGPKPSTKEQTILMMADSLEASSKSLKSPTGEDIDNLVEKIISYKISQGQFEESEITFEELQKCKDVFRKMLRSIHHVRVEYPDEVKPGTGE